MTRQEALREWIFRSKHMKRWLYEYGEAAALRHYVELVDMAIEALQGYCHRIIPSNVEVVVRCKDCKHSFYDKHYENYTCRKHEYVECFDADDYCSWGERND